MPKYLIYLLASVQIFCSTVAYAGVSQEYQLKAAFMFNFARFISWPETALPAPGEPLAFCIVGNNPFEDILTTLEKKTINGRPIKIFYQQSLQSTNSCQLAFFTNTKTMTASINTATGTYTTVTVSDTPGFVNAGGDIEFTRSQGRIQFIINNTSLKQKGLQASSALLELAEKIF